MPAPLRSNPDPARRRAELRGRRAERLAAFWLRLKGWRILDRRFKARGGEADLVILRRGVLAFVEVKARQDTETAAEAIHFVQRTRIERAARWFLARNPLYAAYDIRFDAVLVSGLRLRHVEDAWRPEKL